MEELKDVKIRSCISMRPRAVLEADTTGDHFTWFSWHYSGYDRKNADKGLVHHIPVNLGEIPDYYRRNLPPIDVAAIKVCPKDENGYYNFGGTSLWQAAVVERARTLVVEVNEQLPRVHHRDCAVHESQVDFVIDGDGSPLAELPDTPVTDVDRAVGAFVANEINDGACVQVGIGGMPNAVCSALLQSNVKDLGFQTEMLTDSMIDLVNSGRVTGARKALDPGLLTCPQPSRSVASRPVVLTWPSPNPGRHVYSFALGSKKLYDALDDNPDFLCLPVDATNMPHLVMQNENVGT